MNMLIDYIVHRFDIISAGVVPIEGQNRNNMFYAVLPNSKHIRCGRTSRYEKEQKINVSIHRRRRTTYFLVFLRHALAVPGPKRLEQSASRGHFERFTGRPEVASGCLASELPPGYYIPKQKWPFCPPRASAPFPRPLRPPSPRPEILFGCLAPELPPCYYI